MSGKIVNLIERKPDSKRWTPREALMDAVADIDSGRIKPTKLMVLYVEDVEDRVRASEYICGMNISEHIAFLTIKLHEAIDDWKG
jgi:hypothetical protein